MAHLREGGVTTPKGFRAAGVHCGIKKSADKLDLALIAADGPVSAAAVFTTNRAVAAPVELSREHLRLTGGTAAAIVTNSGCANACTGDAGMQVARDMADATARVLGCRPQHVLVASTGVIGVQLDPAKVRAGIDAAGGRLSADGWSDATLAIMTTDPFPKSCAMSVESAGGTIR